VPQDRQAAIFEPFTQADGSTARSYGGTGLGLTISRRFVEMMGGRLWLESPPGSGATFHFTVNVEVRPTPAAPVAPPDRAGTPPLGALRVLLAEDHVVNRSLAIRLLEKEGITCGRRQRPRGDRGTRARQLRSRADGSADAGDGRFRSDGDHP
jgi:hypothetical protein